MEVLGTPGMNSFAPMLFLLIWMQQCLVATITTAKIHTLKAIINSISFNQWLLWSILLLLLFDIDRNIFILVILEETT